MKMKNAPHDRKPFFVLEISKKCCEFLSWILKKKIPRNVVAKNLSPFDPVLIYSQQ
jgi:hypothetical protein